MPWHARVLLPSTIGRLWPLRYEVGTPSAQKGHVESEVRGAMLRLISASQTRGAQIFLHTVPVTRGTVLVKLQNNSRPSQTGEQACLNRLPRQRTSQGATPGMTYFGPHGFAPGHREILGKDGCKLVAQYHRNPELQSDIHQTFPEKAFRIRHVASQNRAVSRSNVPLQVAALLGEASGDSIRNWGAIREFRGSMCFFGFLCQRS